MNSLIKTRAAAYGREHGLDTEDSPLVSISPALDIIMSCPSDPAHSEYGGISKQLHVLLMSAILTPEAQKGYSDALRGFKFPPGWGRLQSLVHHLGSYGLQEHARWAIIIPALLRCWLKDNHIQPLFLNAVSQVFNSFVSNSKVDIIVTCFASIAKSTTLLMSDRLTAEDRAGFSTTVKNARLLFQNLLETAAQASISNSQSRSATPNRVEAAIHSAVPLADSGENARVTNKSLEYRQDKGRPNVHIGLHYDAVIEEYGLPTQCNVLIGEDKHRYFKKIVYQTNF